MRSNISFTDRAVQVKQGYSVGEYTIKAKARGMNECKVVTRERVKEERL